MATPKNVLALLAEQDEEVLVEMHKNILAEIGELEAQAKLVAEALSKRSRSRSRTRPGDPTTSRNSGVKRQDVLRIVTNVGRPVSPADVRQSLRLEGHDISGAAVRNHLRRLVTDKKLHTDGEGKYALLTVPLSQNGSADPLFTGSADPERSQF